MGYPVSDRVFSVHFSRRRGSQHNSRRISGPAIRARAQEWVKAYFGPPGRLAQVVQTTKD
jgi:hypothetical protein